MELQKVYEILDYVMEHFRRLNVWEVGVFKICLLLFGVLLGTYASRGCRKIAPLLWMCFLASYLYLIYRLLIAPALRPDED